MDTNANEIALDEDVAATVHPSSRPESATDSLKTHQKTARSQRGSRYSAHLIPEGGNVARWNNHWGLSITNIVIGTASPSPKLTTSSSASRSKQAMAHTSCSFLPSRYLKSSWRRILRRRNKRGPIGRNFNPLQVCSDEDGVILPSRYGRSKVTCTWVACTAGLDETLPRRTSVQPHGRGS